MNTIPYEILIRLNEDGSVRGAHQVKLFTADLPDGSKATKELPPEPVALGDIPKVLDPALAQVSALLAERDAASKERDALTTERDQLSKAQTSLAASVQELSAKLKDAATEKDTLQANFTAYKAVAEQAALAIEKVADDQSVNDADSIAVIRKIVHTGRTEVNKDAKERTIDALNAQKDDIEKKIAALQSDPTEANTNP